MNKLKNKSLLLKTSGVIAIFIILGALFNAIDTNRFNAEKHPLFVLKLQDQNDSKITYLGLGYKIVFYPGVSPTEPLKESNSKKGSWFMDFKKPDENNRAHIKKIETIDDFYNTELTKDYDIRKLPKDYKPQAEIATDFIELAKVNDFLKKRQDNKSSFIRTAAITVEGDWVFKDVLYYAPTNQLLVVIDNSRDEFSRSEDKKIFLVKYDNTEIHQNNNSKIWVVYQGDRYKPESSSYESLFILSIAK